MPQSVAEAGRDRERGGGAGKWDNIENRMKRELNAKKNRNSLDKIESKNEKKRRKEKWDR